MIQIGPTIPFGPILGLIILIIGCVLLRPCLLFWRTQRQLRRHGVTVQGQVIDRHQEYLSNGQPWFSLTCRYHYEGQTYVSKQPVWRFQYEQAELDVSVRCLPETPDVASIFGDDFQRAEWVQRTILAVLLCIVGASVAIGSSLGVFTTSRHP